jgi:LysR family hydrogen peroxide-inducible transcriptional activator
MTLQELRYIVALERFGHFGKAAEHCHISQPSLSLGLKKLEDELGICLFERNKHHLAITPLGQEIVSQAKLVLNQAEQIKVLASSKLDPLASPLRLGAIYTIGPYLYPHILPQLKHIAPNMPLLVEEGYTSTLRQKLADNELDAIIVALPFSQSDCVVKSLYEEPFVALLPANHPLSKKDNIGSEDLSKETVLLLGEGHCFRDQVLDACPELKQQVLEQQKSGQQKRSDSNKPFLHQASGTSLETIKHMVASGLGITILPWSAASLNPYSETLVAVRPFNHAHSSREVAIAWRATFPRYEAVEAIIKATTRCQVLEA